MSYKEWDAIIMVVGGLAVMAWVGMGAMAEPDLGLAPLATRLLIAVGLSIAFNIAAHIVIAIVAGILQRKHPIDEPADERDRALMQRAMRNGYLVSSLGALGSLIVLAMGHSAQTGIYVLFTALMTAGIVYAASRFLYYRLG